MGFDPTIPNQPVQNCFNASLRGVTTGSTRRLGTTLHVQVELGVNDKRWFPADELEILVTGNDGIEDLIRGLKFGGIGDLARIITYHKISSNLSNVFYAMQSSRTDFYAYQFKPVYKYIESANSRILIADEVGLGKTIEAGLIWQETRARNPEARRLLIVCPSMLREKWKHELRARFDTRAETYDSKGFLSLLDDFRREGTAFECAAVCSLNTIRGDRIREAISEMSDLHRFDLVIIDEAHHLRNSETKSHRVGLELSDATEAMVLLTATPIHLGNEDLFRLLRILDAAEFDDYGIFDERLKENEPLVRAQNLLRRHPPDKIEIDEQLDSLKSSRWFRGSELLSLVQEQIAGLGENDHSALIEAGRRLEKLNLFSSVISRTRKREVLENRVIRQATAVALEFTERERDFYESVTEAVQARMEGFKGNPISGFAVMMPQRMMASSIPAMVDHYRGSHTVDQSILEEMGLLPDDVDLTKMSDDSWPQLGQLISEWDTACPDSKYEMLRQVLINRFQREPDVKLIVFSFFKTTLRYLEKRLRHEGFGPLLIHGDVPMEDRQEIINDFKNNPKRRILLSSEVGSEGIDLQFCRVMVNYDLPWNPMKVEQRIGRIDRIGQKAERISILNFAVTGTIEEKILNRLYNRIGIFERSLGDLEPILGEVTERLYNELLSRRLSDEEREQRIHQTMLAFENKRQEEIQLVEQSAVFLGSSDYILEQITEARKLGRWITPKDLSAFTQDFFNSFYKGTTLVWDAPAPGLARIHLTNSAKNDLSNFCRSQNPPLRTELAFGRDGDSTLVYDQTTAQDYPQFEMLSHFHPLIKWICDSHGQNSKSLFPTAAVKFSSDLLPPGDYLIAVQFWTFSGARKEIRVEYSIEPLVPGDIKPNAIDPSLAEELIQSMIVTGKTWQFVEMALSADMVTSAWDRAVTNLAERNQILFAEFSRENEDLRLRRQARLRSYGERRDEALQKAIETLREKLHFGLSDKERARIESQIKGNRTRLTNQQHVLEARLRDIEASARTQNEFRDVAAIVCQILQ